MSVVTTSELETIVREIWRDDLPDVVLLELILMLASDFLWLTRVTIWIAVAAWLLRVFVEASRRQFAARGRLIRWTWNIGAAFCAAHVLCALGISHCWSLENALRHTAEVTRRVVGVELPQSVFVNFAFTGLWLVDAWHESRLPEPRPLGHARQITWAVMMLNATVVFGPRYWMWLAIPFAVLLIVIRWRRK